MKGGYKIVWTTKAVTDLENIINYLRKNWTEKEIKNFIKDLISASGSFQLIPSYSPIPEKNETFASPFYQNTTRSIIIPQRE